jgi:hypothetical protein
MNLWCPLCNGTNFYHDKISEVGTIEEPETIIISDKMKCKNKACNYEFTISWYAYVREEWLRLHSEKKKRYIRPGTR